MKLDVVIKKRDFTDPVGFPDVAFRPARYGWSAIGGPDYAEISAGGEERALWSLLNWLRAPIEIMDERGEAVWWGYVNEVTVRTGAVEVGAALTTMANRVAVTYSYIAPGSNTVGTRATTVWAQDDDSVATYGTKELLNSRDGCSTDAAEARRDAILDRLRTPIPQVQVSGGRSELGATLHCLGWWHTLDWTHYSRNAGLEDHTEGSASQDLGRFSGDAQLEQSFQLTGGESWDAHSISVRLSIEGAPADTLYVRLYSGASYPTTLLATGSRSGSSLPTAPDWITFALDTPVALALGTTYWIVLSRSGGVNDTNYYTVSVDEGLGYPSGILRLYNGSTRVARSPDADLLFKVEGVEETTTQVAAAIEAEGQFLGAVDLASTSGVRSSQYRDGDTTALQVVEALLADGTSAGKRLLATVKRDRTVKVYAEPSEDTPTLYLPSDGRPEDRWGNLLLAHTCPVAQWCELKDVIPVTVDTGELARPSPFFVERAEFDVRRLLWTPEPRGTPSPWEIGEMVAAL